MSSFEVRRLSHFEATIRTASGGQIVAIERLVAEVASIRIAEVALARRTEVIPARLNLDLLQVGVVGEASQALYGERIPGSAERIDDGVTGV
jgi:hypothetical protein